MLIIVIIFNILLTLFNLYLAWQIWKISRVLSQLTVNVKTLDRNFQHIFLETPLIMASGAVDTKQVQLQYLRLMLQVQQLEKLFKLLKFLGKWKVRSRK